MLFLDGAEKFKKFYYYENMRLSFRGFRSLKNYLKNFIQGSFPAAMNLLLISPTTVMAVVLITAIIDGFLQDENVIHSTSNSSIIIIYFFILIKSFVLEDFT